MVMEELTLGSENSALYKCCIIELYTWKLILLANVTPINKNLKK